MAGAGDVAHDHPDRHPLRRQHIGHHGGRRQAAQCAEAESALRCFQVFEAFHAGAGADIDHRIRRARTADIREFRWIEADALNAYRALDKPGAAWNADGQAIGQRALIKVIGGDDTVAPSMFARWFVVETYRAGCTTARGRMTPPPGAPTMTLRVLPTIIGWRCVRWSRVRPKESAPPAIPVRRRLRRAARSLQPASMCTIWLQPLACRRVSGS